MEKKETILVTGATGAQGGSVAKALLESKKFNLRVLTRNAKSQKAKLLAEQGAEIFTGDMNDKQSLLEAMKGVYGVFGVTNYWEHLEMEYDLGKNLIDAVKESGVQHFVFSTLPNYFELSNGEYPVPHYDIKSELQEYAKSLNLPATFVHMSFYYENFLTIYQLKKDYDDNLYFGFPAGIAKLSMATPEDLGDIVSTILDHPKEYIGRTVGVVGEDRSVAEYAHIMTRVFGRRVYYKYIPREEFAKSGMPAAEELANMFEVQRLHILNRQIDLIESYGLNPAMQTFESWLRKNKEKFSAIITRRADYVIY